MYTVMQTDFMTRSDVDKSPETNYTLLTAETPTCNWDRDGKKAPTSAVNCFNKGGPCVIMSM